ncbi:T9SS type A sorting domain-containing protein [Hymenobacter ruricola]|uniref:T9SS type A sorting domain-containing protein n=1 Tax=Hymenobacter ruricola TaxID=2791023 RepID=A0ABS0I3G8_9BACT|nr:T9SS type A sorting domain-containing protein [Hymenobacter ruricola]MBF9221467.1 T9SS type A sorting domain-containing protein [Hymenobacter ruricola]
MPISTFFFFRFIALVLLAGLGVSGRAGAQTAPNWAGARALGAGTQFLAEGAVDAAGNFYEVGRFTGSTVVDGVPLVSRGNYDAFLAKYTPTGTLAWVRQIGGSAYEDAIDVAVDAAGNAYVAGEFSGSVDFGGVVLSTGSAFSTQGFVARYSPQGTALWVKACYSTGLAPNPATSVSVDAAGQVYLTGNYQGVMTVGSASLPFSPDMGVYVAQLSGATGAEQWLQPACRYTSAQGNGFRRPQLATGPAGDTYLLVSFSAPLAVGSTAYASSGFFDDLIIRISAQGTPQWAQQYGGIGDDWLSEAAVDGAGNLYVSGDYNRPLSFGSIAITSSGNLHAYLAKYSPAGVALWAQVGTGTSGTDSAVGLAVDAAGNAYLTGGFTNQAAYGSFTLTNTANGNLPTVSVVAFSPQGQVRWAQQAQGSGSSSGRYIGLDAGGNLYLLGGATGNVALGAYALNVGNGYETFAARLSTVLSVRAAASLSPLRFYPNPATNLVHLPSLPVGTRVLLLDAQGRVARETTVSAAAEVPVLGLAPGLYTLRATDTLGRQYTARVVVE